MAGAGAEVPKKSVDAAGAGAGVLKKSVLEVAGVGAGVLKKSLVDAAGVGAGVLKKSFPDDAAGAANGSLAAAGAANGSLAGAGAANGLLAGAGAANGSLAGAGVAAGVLKKSVVDGAGASVPQKFAIKPSKADSQKSKKMAILQFQISFKYKPIKIMYSPLSVWPVGYNCSNLN